MADNNDATRLAELEARLQALEGKGSSGSPPPQQGAAPNADQAALVQAFLQGALIGSAGAQASAGADQGASPAFLSLFSCGGGWSPTHYDSVFWCKSRFMCNPASLSCLC